MDLFGTAGIRGAAETTVTPALALQVGRAVGREAETVVVGRDGRLTGRALADAVASGAESGGADVRRAGQVPTPALAFASRGRTGVMVTASHNPPPDNGLKVFVDGVEADAGREAAIESAVAGDAAPAAWDAWGESETVAPLPDYRAAVAEYVRDRVGGLDGTRVLVDCGNGTAGRAAPQVIGVLGADVTALHANVDGRFPARESKPTPDSLEDTRAYLADAADDGVPYDVGLAHDGDADRTVVLDGSGDVVHEDTVLAVLAHHYVAASDAEDPVVVTTPNASGRVDERVTAAGGRVERTALGTLHEGVARAREAGGTVAFAGEPWKHVHPPFGGWMDGVVTGALVAALAADAGGLDALRAPVSERPYRKVNVECPDDRKAAAMERVLSTLPDAFPEATVDTDYGVRVDRPDGSWVLVRPSGTEPYLRIYAESDDVDALVDHTRSLVRDAVAGAG